MPGRLKTWVPFAAVVVVLAIGWLVANQPTGGESGPDLSQAASDESVTATSQATPAASAPSVASKTAAATKSAGASPAAVRRDLELDELRGGHTIARHVGKSEQELRDRLTREPDISAASSYFDLETAEMVVAAALSKRRSDIDRWVGGTGPRANLALRFTHDAPAGLKVERGAQAAREINSVVVVLRWANGDWYVLTSYPDD